MALFQASTRPRCFVSGPPTPQFQAVAEAIERAAKEASFRISRVDDSATTAPIRDIISGELARSDCIVADLTGQHPNVFFEMGLAQAMGKAVFPLLDMASHPSVPVELRDMPFLTYDVTPEGLNELTKRLSFELRRFRRSPRRTRQLVASQFATPFFVDWNRLERVETENLCRELLAQMGFHKVDWLKESREIDLVAELPKKDPDGFEYRELWLVAMGRNVPIEMVVDWATTDPERILNRFLRSDEQRERLLARSAVETPLTLLCIMLEEPSRQQTLFESDERRARLRMHGLPPLRIRVWDRNYLTTLVQQFRQIGYKYFSDEGRSRSKFRKTPEELYQENVVLAERVTAALTALENEKNRRVRAERDAVWKDISFSTAHKIGNPLFAIETFLDPLEKRIREERVEEAFKIVVSMRSAVERAKAFVDQFKSLTRAQEINLQTVLLSPLIEDACQVAETKNVICTINCPPDTAVIADPARLRECFEELTANALHWMRRAEKRIEVNVFPRTAPLPPELDSSREYVLIHFKDNGVGVKPEEKLQIFNAFHTTYDHGTGLGLALVRRIIEGHGGVIFETGSSGEGADFEIYIPAVPLPEQSVKT